MKKNWFAYPVLAGVALFMTQLGGCSDGEELPPDESLPQEEPANGPTAANDDSNGGPASASPEFAPIAPDGARGRVLDELKAASEALDRALEANPDSPETQRQFQSYIEKNDAYANLIGKVTVADGHVVKFYEPQPGTRLYVELLPIDGEPVLSAASDRIPTLEEVHRTLLPEADVPEALLQADARAMDGSSVSLQDPQEFPEIRPQLTLEKHAAGCQHFIDHGGCPAASAGPCNNDFPWCICDINVDNTVQVAGWATVSNWFVASVVGSVSIDLIVNGNSLGIFAIPNGVHGSFSMISPSGKGDLYCNCGTWQACQTRTCHTWHFGEIENFNPNEVYHFGGVLRRGTC